jgi:uncharacterized protein YdaU (DUF1376 family)
MAAWKAGGSLPNHDGQLAAVCRLSAAKWKASKPILLAFFGLDGARVVHKRVTAERAKAQNISEKKSQNGKGGAAKRWQTAGGSDGKAIADAKADASQTGRQTDAPSPSPSPSESSVAKATGGEPPVEMTTQETIFHYGVPLLTQSGVKEERARSFLGGLVKGHGPDLVIAKLRECFKAKPLAPLEWLGAALPPKDIPKKLEWHEHQAGIEAMGVKLGVGMWVQTEQFPSYKNRVMQAHQQGAH